MGSLYRSEEMTLCQLFLQSEAAYACVSELGELGLVQFRDLNPDVNAFKRKFVNEVRRCDEMERKLRFLEKEIRKDEIPMLDTGDNPDAPAPREMIDLEATFEKLENEMKEVNANSEALKRNFLELTELKHILRKTQAFFEEAATDPNMAEESIGLLGEEQMRHGGGQALRLGFVAGVILRERIQAFERMLWRACRGNVFLKQAEIEAPLEDPATGDQVNKSVFIIFFQGDQLKSRVKKICEGFRASLYPCPETPAERREMAIGVMTRIEDLNTVLSQTQDHRQRVLVAAAKNIKVWFIKVRKIKAIYHTLNMFNLDVTQKCLIGECWCPVADLDTIQLALRRGTERSGSSVPSILNRMTTQQQPPTYHRVNKFTAVFQDIVDAYGIATYREVNPAPWAIISFPFLFSVMFGDAGHGFIMFLFGLWMLIKEKQLLAKKGDNEIWNMFFGGRYVITLMGAFSVYSGMLYNDAFSKSFNIFGSSWSANDGNYPPAPNTSLPISVIDLQTHTPIMLTSLGVRNYINVTGYKEYIPLPNGSDFSGQPYPYGIDPVWQLSDNKLTFLNSYKMKLSIIFGITQMIFGVVLSLFNHLHFKKRISVFFEFIPQIIFINMIFGYLVIEIFYKWFRFDEKDSTIAPSLLIHLINMFLMKYCYQDCATGVAVYYPGQKAVQTVLLLVALACVPIMVVVKPCLLKRKHQGNPHRRLTEEHHADVTVPIAGGEEVVHHETVAPSDVHVEPEFNFGEVIVTSAIHTIEYCLGCISHTASYLRLWALSLAHAELSEVLWSMVFRVGLSLNGYLGAPALFIVFAPWAVLTVAVLLLMEGLSAFLHTLRLHWVEFQSKFYVGEGYKFMPFSFTYIIENDIDEMPQ